MRKLLLLMIALLAGVSGAWADVLNLTPSNGTYVTGDNYVNSISFSSSPAITVTASANNMDKRQTSTYLLWHSGQSGSSTYTISAGAGYIITAYSVTGEANTSAQTLTAGAVSHVFAVGASSSFEVTGLKSPSVSFVQTGANASGLKITSISVTVAKATDEQIAAYNIVQSWIPTIQGAKGLVSNASNYISNAKSTAEGTYEALLDQDYATYFHGAYGSEGPDEDQYLQATLSKSVDAIYFYYKKRSQNNNNRPTSITISGSNDGSNFTDITTINSGLPTSADVLDYTSSKINLGASYQYLRFTVTATNNGATNQKGHVFFTFSEFYILPSETEVDNVMDLRVSLAGTDALDYTEQNISDVTAANTALLNTMVNVTYNLYEADGETFVDSRVVEQEKNSAVSVPAALTTLTYYDYDTEGSIGTTDCTIKVTRSLKSGYVISLDGLNNSKCYNIRNNRGTWAVGSGATDINSTVELGLAFLSSDTKQQFAFITYEGRVYLYSVGEGKFAYVDGNKLSLTAAVTSAVAASPVTFQTSTASSANAEPIIVTVGGQMYGVSTGHTPDVFKYNVASDGGNSAIIIEAASFDATSAIAALEEYFHPSYTITYVVKDVNGTTIFTSDPVPTSLGVNITTLPTEYQRGFCSYNSVDVTISEVSTVIEFTATYTGLPFTLSPSYAEATWYNMNIRSTKDVSKGESEPYALAAATIADKAEDAYRWAFAGNPYALVVYNKATADTYTLTKDGNNAVMRDGTYTWSLFQNGDGFTLKVTGSAYNYVNDNNNALGFWNDSRAATDNGSTFRVEAVVDNYYDYVKAEVLPFIFDNPEDIIDSSTAASLGKPFGITTAASESMVWTYRVQMSTKNFSLSEYEAIKAEKDAAIIYPEAGKIYLVKNNYNGKYMRVTASGTRGTVLADLTAEEAAKDASAHFTFVENASHLYMSTQGEYLNWVFGAGDGYEGYTSTNFDKYVHFAVPAPGVGAFSIAYGNGEGGYAGYLGNGFYALKGAESTVVAGSSTDETNALAQWTFEEVKTLTVDLHDGGDGYNYATLCVPFAFSDIMGAVYTLAANADGHTLDVTPVANVPAGTPVLLKSTASSIDFTLGSDYASTPVAGSALTGTYFAKTIVGDTDYVLGTDGTKVGFYHWDTNNLAANRAYVAGGAGVKGFTINWGDAVGIKSVDNGQALDNANIFNLAGQRLNKVQRGVNIVNGKKVIVK